MACPTAGLLLTLIGWGAAATGGASGSSCPRPGLAGLILLAARDVHGAAGLGVGLALAGAAGGSVFAASGRLILGWFARRERGLAMGIRQSAQPLGVAVAAVTLPTLGRRRPGRAAAVPGRVLPGRGGGCDRAGARSGPAAPRLRRPRPGPRLAVPAAGAVADPRGQRAAGRVAVHRGHVRAGVPGRRARLGRRPRRPAAGRRARPAGPPPGSARATGRTGPAAGCGRCASWPSAPAIGHARAGRRRRGALAGRPCRCCWSAAVVAVSTNGLAVHRRGRVRRLGVGRPRAGHPEHRPERARRGHPAGPGSGHRGRSASAPRSRLVAVFPLAAAARRAGRLRAIGGRGGGGA